MDKEETFIPDNYEDYSGTVKNQARSTDVLVSTIDKLINLKSINYKTMADNLWIYYETNVYDPSNKDDWYEDDILLDKIDGFRLWLQHLDTDDYQSISGLDVVATKLEQYILNGLNSLEDTIIEERNKNTLIAELKKNARTTK